MEVRLLASEILGRCGMFWYQLTAEIEYLQINLVTTKYGCVAMAAGKVECWTVVLTMVQVIC